MLCHTGPVKALAIDLEGKYMVTSGLDGFMKVWDNRSYRPLHEYITPTPATSLSISQRNLIAAGFGPNVQVFLSFLLCSCSVTIKTWTSFPAMVCS